MFQDFNSRTSKATQLEMPVPRLDDLADLISRYPNLSEVELARLINLYRHVSALDVALMSSDEELGPKLNDFFEDHRSQLKTPFRQYAIFVAIGVVGMIVTIWAAIVG